LAVPAGVGPIERLGLGRERTAGRVYDLPVGRRGQVADADVLVLMPERPPDQPQRGEALWGWARGPTRKHGPVGRSPDEDGRPEPPQPRGPVVIVVRWPEGDRVQEDYAPAADAPALDEEQWAPRRGAHHHPGRGAIVQGQGGRYLALARPEVPPLNGACVRQG